MYSTVLLIYEGLDPLCIILEALPILVADRAIKRLALPGSVSSHLGYIVSFLTYDPPVS